MRGVSRQAIVRLVKKGRFTTLCIGEFSASVRDDR